MAIKYFNWWPAKFAHETRKLSDAEVGLYIRMINLAAEMAATLPADPGEICHMLNKTKHNAPKVQAILDMYWELDELRGVWIQKRLQMEVQKAEALLSKRLDNLGRQKSAKSRKRKKPASPNGSTERTPRMGSTTTSSLKENNASKARDPHLDDKKETSREEVLEFHANQVKQGKAWVTNTIGPNLARDLLSADLVTEDDLKKMGVAF